LTADNDFPEMKSELPGEGEANRTAAGSAAAGSFERTGSRRRLLVFILIGGIVIGALSWYDSRWSAGAAAIARDRQDKQIFSDQLAACKAVSPPADQLLEKWGITYALQQALDSSNRITLTYHLRLSPNGPVEKLQYDTNHWFDESSLQNAASGAKVELITSSTGGSSAEINGNLLSQPLTATKPIPQFTFTTPVIYAFLQTPAQVYPFAYSGGRQTIPLNQEFDYQGIKFRLDSLELDDNTFQVLYHQLTPAQEAGVFQLDFQFDDRLGNVSVGQPQLAVTDPKEFRADALHSPAKHWYLRLTHVVQVIPGITRTLQWNGGN
jgi:hypothetical protein